MKASFKYMRWIRILIALIIFYAIGIKFFDMYSKFSNSYLENFPLLIQFVPSLLRMFAFLSIAAGSAFIIFTIISFLFGRAYCSFICPFGILMDIIRHIATFPSRNSKIKKTALGKLCQKKFSILKFHKSKNILRISFLSIAIFLIAFGYTGILGFIEPYSLFGKIMGNIAHPIACLAVNELCLIFSKFDIYWISPVNGDPTVSAISFALALLILVAISIASAMRGRIFCNTICPVGAFLGLFSKFSVFKISLNKKSCVACGMCERECKAECIDSKNKSVDSSKCVLCFNCVKVCPRDSVEISLNEIYKKDTSQKTSPSTDCVSTGRRSFPKTVLSLAALLCIAAKKERKRGKCCDDNHKISEDASPYGIDDERPDKRLASPPGSESLDNFLNHCTGCQICTTACETHILKPSITEWGLAGFSQPFMDFSVGFCVHNCTDCSSICPVGAIKPISKKTKLQLKIGTAIFKKCLCVVHTDGTDCAACAEHCPVQAIEMIPFGKKEDSLYIPHVHEDVCIGCGACEYICPVLPYKAIVVQGIKNHRKAKVFEESMRIYKPEKKETPAKTPANKTNEDPFPF